MRKNVKFRTAILYSILMVLMTQVSYFGNYEMNEEKQTIEEFQDPKYSIETGTAIQIDSGGAHSCAISATGEIKCCCLLYTSPSPRDRSVSRMPSSA